jgi:uncharacterized damage-inducible protein DinB
MTGRLSLLFAALAGITVVAHAQAPAPSADPISASTSKMYTMLGGVVIAAAEKMPEGNYSFKPTPEVRSFGQLVGHLADSQYYFCSLAAGEAKPATEVEKSKTQKADLVAALKEAVDYCAKRYASMTDAKGGETVKLMNNDFARLTVLAANTAHNYEHYGNMVTYMRLKGIVPPSSEKASGPEKPSSPEKK